MLTHRSGRETYTIEGPVTGDIEILAFENREYYIILTNTLVFIMFLKVQ